MKLYLRCKNMIDIRISVYDDFIYVQGSDSSGCREHARPKHCNIGVQSTPGSSDHSAHCTSHHWQCEHIIIKYLYLVSWVCQLSSKWIFGQSVFQFWFSQLLVRNKKKIIQKKFSSGFTDVSFLFSKSQNDVRHLQNFIKHSYKRSHKS